jgi:hypothetical protein
LFLIEGGVALLEIGVRLSLAADNQHQDAGGNQG